MGKKVPMKDIDVLNLINTSELYGLINDNIDKYNHRNTVQGVTNDMIGNTNVSKTVHSSNEVTYMEQDEINDLNEDLCHLRYGLGDNINDDDHKNNHYITNLANNGLKSNKALCAHIVEKRKDSFMDGLTRMMSGTITTM